MSLIRANLLSASIPWGNSNDAFLVADRQKSSSSCLEQFAGPDNLMEVPLFASTMEKRRQTGI